MPFVFIYVHVYRCPTRFPYQMIFVSFNTADSHGEQELLTLLEHLSSSTVFRGVRVAGFLIFRVMFCRSLFVLFLLAIVFCLSFILQLLTIIQVQNVSSNFSQVYTSTIYTSTITQYTYKLDNNLYFFSIFRYLELHLSFYFI